MDGRMERADVVLDPQIGGKTEDLNRSSRNCLSCFLFPPPLRNSPSQEWSRRGTMDCPAGESRFRRMDGWVDGRRLVSREEEERAPKEEGIYFSNLKRRANGILNIFQFFFFFSHFFLLEKVKTLENRKAE